eukprot:1323504-Amorphochlora_amoeboformis.AAC.1
MLACEPDGDEIWVRWTLVEAEVLECLEDGDRMAECGEGRLCLLQPLDPSSQALRRQISSRLRGDGGVGEQQGIGGGELEALEDIGRGIAREVGLSMDGGRRFADHFDGERFG